MRQLVLDLLPENPPSLDNFVPGANAQALTAVSAWKKARHHEPFLFLWGESGAGKTHLLRACSSHYVDASAAPDLPGLDAVTGEASDHFAVDNVDALDATGQITLFNLFNRLRAAGGRLLAAASQPPLQLALREDLRTRLGSGLIFRLHALSDEEKISALAAQAKARGLSLPSGALDYLLARVPRDMRSLMAFLVALDRYSLEHKRPITLPLLREVLHHSPF
ncbi:MAG: DnaA regulatory inactivator Hda [Propionivibrio sp.]|jgi:DnaA family protein|nr:DnaA regulatory inactivator Hda [Propionivibrio sp.]